MKNFMLLIFLIAGTQMAMAQFSTDMPRVQVPKSSFHFSRPGDCFNLPQPVRPPLFIPQGTAQISQLKQIRVRPYTILRPSVIGRIPNPAYGSGIPEVAAIPNPGFGLQVPEVAAIPNAGSPDFPVR